MACLVRRNAAGAVHPAEDGMLLGPGMRVGNCLVRPGARHTRDDLTSAHQQQASDPETESQSGPERLRDRFLSNNR